MAVDDEYTKALLHFNGDDESTIFTDESGKTWTAYGNAQLDTAQKKFGTASGYFDGTGDYIQTPAQADFNFGTDDFTVDFWFNPSRLTYQYLFALQHGTSTYKMSMYITSSTQIGWTISGALGEAGSTFSCSLSVGTWYHFAFVRSSGVFKFYLDGVLKSTYSTNVYDFTDGNNYIGIRSDLSTAYQGYIDEFRISNIARWTANFTPPTSEYGAESENISVSSEPLVGTFTLNAAGASIISNIIAAESFLGTFTLNAAGADILGDIVFAEPFTGTFTLNSAGGAVLGDLSQYQVAALPFTGAFTLSGDARLIERTSFNSTLTLLNSIKLGSTLSLVNSLNVQFASNITLVNDLLRQLSGTQTLKLNIEEMAKFNGMLKLGNHILGTGSGITHGEYYFLKSHGL